MNTPHSEQSERERRLDELAEQLASLVHAGEQYLKEREEGID